MFKGIFNLTLWATQGLFDSLLELMNVPLCAPDYSCVSKRARSVTVAYRQPPKGRITDLVIDSTGLKVFGEGEWKVRKHGTEKFRVWCKLHLAVDPVTHDFVVAEVSLENVHDVEVLPILLKPLWCKLGRIYADGAYGSKASHQLISQGATACIPPRKNAGLWEKGYPRNKAMQEMREEGLVHWKRMSGYHRRSLTETAMYRFKQENQSAELQRPGVRRHDVCKREIDIYSLDIFFTNPKTPSIVVTWGWGSIDSIVWR